MAAVREWLDYPHFTDEMGHHAFGGGAGNIGFTKAVKRTHMPFYTSWVICREIEEWLKPAVKQLKSSLENMNIEPHSWGTFKLLETYSRNRGWGDSSYIMVFADEKAACLIRTLWDGPMDIRETKKLY